MGPPPPEAKAPGSSDDEEEDHEHYNHAGDPAPQDVDRSPSMPILAKDNERRVDSKFCIGANEPELHKGALVFPHRSSHPPTPTMMSAHAPPQQTFAVTRRPSASNVYLQIQHAPHYQALDEYCDAASFSLSLSSSSSSSSYSSSRPSPPADPPLVLYGPSGVGKSALLSNWLLHHQAQREAGKAMVSSSSPSRASVHKEDFVFWHVAGCSRSSALTTNLLRRLQCQLKTHFGLKKEVAKDDKRLRWDLPDFLELASRKAAPSLILILVDGLHLLRDEEGEEDLRWLPQVYPASVRLVVSTTIYETTATGPRVEEEGRTQDGGEAGLLKDSGDSLSMPAEESASLGSKISVSLPIGENNESSSGGDADKGDAVVLSSEENRTFHELCRRGWDLLRVDEMSLPACQELLSSCVAPTRADGRPSTTSPEQDLEASLLSLFPSQCQALLASPASKNPLFLRLLLQALRWSARQNLDLWGLLAFWAGATTVVELYGRILDTWEQGLSVSSASRDEALRRVAQEQLAQARPPGTELMDEWGNASSRGSQHAVRRGDDGSSRSSRARSDADGQDVPDELPLAEIQWRKVHADADKTIEDARVAVEDAASRAMAEALETVQAGTNGDLTSGAAYPNEAIVHFLVHRKQQALVSSTGAAEAVPHPSTAITAPPTSVMKSQDTAGTAMAALTKAESEDPAVSLSTDPNTCSTTFADVPLYLRGGEDFEGLGNMLGNTLAALYVARHGLTMDELVHLLLDVQERDDQRLCVFLWKHKDVLLQSCDVTDMHQQGVLQLRVFEGIVLDRTRDPPVAIMRRDLRRLLLESSALSLDKDGAVKYDVFFDYCGAQATQVSPTLFESPSANARRHHRIKNRGLALGDGMTQKLLDVLTTLGVLVPREDHVLVLMLESEALRQAVHCRYIQSGANSFVKSTPTRADAPGAAADDGGGITYGEATWHQAIIQYFQSQPSSLLRRCEELPWHLHVCQEWKALKTFLVELDTFKMMYRGGLKGELFEYWRLLTEGPLWAPREPAPEGSKGDHALPPLLQDESCSQKEQAALTQAPGRKRVPTFDIVECYNQSVEQWKASAASLSTQVLADVLWLVGRFLAEFAEGVIFRSPFPRYLRKPLDLGLMEMVNVEKKGDESLASKLFLRPLPPPPPRKEKHGSDDDDDDASSDEDGEKEEAGQHRLLDDQGLGASTDDWQDGEDEDDGTDESDQARQRRHRRLEVMQSRAALTAMDSAYYYFKRWFWIQFPWMALVNVDLALRQYLEEELGEPVAHSSSTTKPSPLALLLGPASHEDGGSDTADTIGLTLAASTSSVRPHRSPAQPLVWAIHKQDPTRIRALAPESIQFRTMVKSSALHLAPHAESTPRLVDALFHDDPGLVKSLESQRSSAGSGNGGDDGGHGNDDDERDREDGLHTVFASGCSGLVSTRREKQMQHSDRRVARLRAILDQVAAERSSMQAQLTALHRQATARDLHDGQTLLDMETGDFLMQALLMRLRRLTEALTEAKALGWYFEKIVEQCLLKNPVNDPQRLDALDKQLDLATSQYESLDHHRSLIRAEKEQLATEEVVKVQRHLDHLAAKRRQVQDRLKQVHRRRRQQQSAMAATSHSRTLRHAMAFISRGLKGEGGEKQLRGRGSHALYPSSSSSASAILSARMAAEAESRAQPKKLTAFQSIFAAKRSERVRVGMEKLFEMSGVNATTPAVADRQPFCGATTTSTACSDSAELAAQCVIRMFRRVQKSNKVFMDDAHGLEAMVLSLRAQLQAQETKLVNSTLDTTAATPGAAIPPLLIGKTAASPSFPYSTAAATHEEELRCTNYRQLSAGAHEVLDQLKMGVNHLARLVAPHSASLPLATLRSANGEHADHYDDVDLHQVFALFDERITSIYEIVALDTNEKADGAIKMFANASTKADRGGVSAGSNSGASGSTAGNYHELVSSMVEDTTNKSVGIFRGKAGVTNPGRPNTAGAGSELLGIDMDTVMHMKGEAARSKKMSSSLSPQRPLLSPDYGLDGRSPRRTLTDNTRIRIQDLASMEESYESGVVESRKRDDDLMARLEREEQQQVFATDPDETASFFHDALVRDSPSHLRMRQVMKQEWNIKARQYAHVDEMHGLAIDQVLRQAHTSMKKILGWDKDGRVDATEATTAKASISAEVQNGGNSRAGCDGEGLQRVHLSRRDASAGGTVQRKA